MASARCSLITCGGGAHESRANLGWKIICELNIPSGRTHFKLLNATFRFESKPS